MKVLIVDDSRIFRNLIETSLKGESQIEIIGSVWNGVKAIEFIGQKKPDVVTLDLDMPEMDGLETLAEIEKINSGLAKDEQIGVIMVSALTERGADVTIKALNAGAFDFITKPSGDDINDNLKSLNQQLKNCFFSWKNRKSEVLQRATSAVVLPKDTELNCQAQVIAIGISTGGPKALRDLLPELCKVTTLPILIVQHMPAQFTKSLAESIDRCCSYDAKEAESGEEVVGKKV
ncbi:MAG: response regulator, partial [Planctomycetes bacterium]|nr:response regulator [Planctomycetota bacterium]